VKVKKHIPSETKLEEIMKFGIYLIETGSQKSDELKSGKISVIWDREGEIHF
jgi:hypothetical protein